MRKPAKTSKQKPGQQSNAEWIRSQPASMSAKELVEAAEAQDIEISLQQVYSTRSAAKKVDKRPSPQRRPNGHFEADTRQEFIKLAVRIGTDEAQRLLAGIHQTNLGQ